MRKTTPHRYKVPWKGMIQIGDGEDMGLTGLPPRRSSGGKQGKAGSWQGLKMQLISFSFGFWEEKQQLIVLDKGSQVESRGKRDLGRD